VEIEVRRRNSITAAAGLKRAETFDVSWVYVYADDDALTRSLLSAGGAATPPERGSRSRAVPDRGRRLSAGEHLALPDRHGLRPA